MKDGEWGKLIDIPGERCQSTREVGGYLCGEGLKGQSKKCSRSLGGKYCTEQGEDIPEDVFFKTSPCKLNECPGMTNQ